MSSILTHFPFIIVVFLLILPSFPKLLSLALPFVLGFLLSMISEPLVGQLEARWTLRRRIASPIGVTTTLLLISISLAAVTTFFFRQLMNFSPMLPDMVESSREGTSVLRSWLLSLAEKMPQSLQKTLISGIEQFMSTTLLEDAISALPGIATGFLSGISKGLLTIVTAILSSYLFSSRLPMIRASIRRKIPKDWHSKEKLQQFRRSMGGWLLAECKLSMVTFGLLVIGFFLMGLSQSIVWAGIITLVDILPLLGAGTILLPWSILCFLQSDVPKGFALLGIFGIVWLVRSVLEPKLLGKELGLDPLLTLMTIYAGFRLAGLMGMLLAPIVAVSLQQLTKQL